MLVLDTDIASAFAKAEIIDHILKLFKNEVAITPRIYDELKVPPEYGFNYPKLIFEKIKVIELTSKEQDEYLKQSSNLSIGKGEIEGIVVCKNRGFLFSSLDRKAVQFAKARGVKIVVLKAILRALWERGIMTKEELKRKIKDIEDKDNRKIDVDGVF